MKISIITVCYNSSTTIRDTINSVLTQTHPHIEYIIIDGASTDNTLAIIGEYQDKIACVISEPDKGLYDAMNKGIQIATGDFIGTLNSDDLFDNPKVIENLVNFLNKHSDLDAVYTDLIYVSQHDTNKKTRTYRVKNISLWKIRFGFMLPHPTFYVKRKLFKKLGFYKINYRVAADFELMLRFLLNRISIARLPITMVRMREGGISSTGFWWIIHQNMEIVRACKENGFYTNLLFISMKIPFKLASRFL